jgi:hypothetical protein
MAKTENQSTYNSCESGSDANDCSANKHLRCRQQNGGDDYQR